MTFPGSLPSLAKCECLMELRESMYQLLHAFRIIREYGRTREERKERIRHAGFRDYLIEIAEEPRRANRARCSSPLDLGAMRSIGGNWATKNRLPKCNNNQQKIGRFADLSLFPSLAFLLLLTLSCRVIRLARLSARRSW